MADPYIPFGYSPPRLGPPRPQPQAPADLQSIMDILGGQPLSMGAQPTEDEALDLQQQGQGMVNMATMAAPFALGGPMAIGARGLASLARMYPMTTTAAAGGGALVGESTAAGPPQKQPQQKGPNAAAKPAPKPKAELETGADPALQRLLDSDALLRGLQKQIDEQNVIANAPAGNDPAAGTYPKSSRDGARARAADLQKEYNARLMELSRANLPFDQAYPWLAQNRAVLSFAAPMGAGYATRTAGNLMSRIGPARYERALKGADRALERGNERAYQHYMDRAARFEPGPQGPMSRLAHTAAPPVAGAGIGAEMSMLPYQHNITNAPPGSPQRQEAEEMLGSPMNWLPRAAYGGTIGALGGYSGSHFPNIPFGFRPPPGMPPIPPPGPATTGPTMAAPQLPAAQASTALPQPQLPPAAPALPPPMPASGSMWPAPPSPTPGASPGLANLGNQSRPAPLAPEAPPPVPSQVGAPPRPMPEGAFQARNGRWMVMTPRGPRFIPNP